MSLRARYDPTWMRFRAWNLAAPNRWRGPTTSIWWVVPGSTGIGAGYGTPLGYSAALAAARQLTPMPARVRDGDTCGALDRDCAQLASSDCSSWRPTHLRTQQVVRPDPGQSRPGSHPSTGDAPLLGPRPVRTPATPSLDEHERASQQRNDFAAETDLPRRNDVLAVTGGCPGGPQLAATIAQLAQDGTAFGNRD